MHKRRNVRFGHDAGDPAYVFAALGDATRLGLVSRLCDRGPASITTLAADFAISRQAITKHLRMMQNCGLLHSSRHGRERIWQLNEKRVQEVRHYLELISREWDNALERLRSFVEQ